MGTSSEVACRQLNDEYLNFSLGQDMDLHANITIRKIATALADLALDGVIDIAPGVVSALVHFEPEKLSAATLISTITSLATLDENSGLTRARVIDLPVFFNDPETQRVVAEFRSYHQEPGMSDAEFAAYRNGISTVDELFVQLTSALFVVVMTGFIPTTPFCYQLVPRSRQIQAPKYPRPRTTTPSGAFCWGGCFGAVNPVSSAGGYQLFGRCPAPIVDFSQTLPDFSDSFAFLRPGDIISFRSVQEDEFTDIQRQAAAGTFRHRYLADVVFDTDACLDQPELWAARYRRCLDEL